MLAQTLDPSFQPTVLKNTLIPFLYQSVNALAVQPDGKVLVAGGFDFVNGALAGKLQRLNANGSTDAAFNPGGTGANGYITEVLLQPDGKILVAGSFTTFNSQPKALLVRLNANGSLDPSFAFNPAPGDFRSLNALAVQADGKILVAGGLTFTGRLSGGLVRLNADGTPDASFNPGSGITSGTARAVLVQADGKILLGGTFTSFNGQAAGNLVRLTAAGSIDASFNISTSATPGADGTVNALAQQPDGKLLIGGSFASFDGQVSRNLTRRLLNGGADATFQPNTAGPTGAGSILRIAVQANGGIILAGGFSSYNSISRQQFIRLDAAGVLDVSFAPVSGPSGACGALALAPSGDVYVGGGFNTYNGAPHTGLLRLSATGLHDMGFTPLIEARGIIREVVPLPSGKLLVFGDFINFNGQPLQPGFPPFSLHRLNADGTLDQTFASTSAATIQALQPDGTFYLLGNPAIRLLPDGGIDNSFAGQTLSLTSGTSPAPQRGIVALPNNKVLMYGQFDSYGSLGGLSGLVRVNADGSPDNTFTPPAGPASRLVGQVLVQPGGKLVVVSSDSQGPAGLSMVRLNADGTADNTFSIGAGAGPGGSYRVLMQANGRLLIGSLTSASFNGQAVPYGLTRLTVDGAVDPTFTGLADNYTVRAVQADGRLLVTRVLPIANNAAAALLRLNADGSLDGSFSPIAIPQAIGFSDDRIVDGAGVALQPTDGKILLYGSFRYVAGQVRIGLARLSNVGLATRTAQGGQPLALYPNPAREAVTVQLPVATQARPAALLNLNGRTVRRWSVAAGQPEATFSLENVAGGIYLLQVQGQGAVYQQKVVVAP
ncbi:T9SS type A sorting domain-containing protein [Hymenobacter saemangeumensis]|uniref:T9SS type A sorting domain-containing protein n=1 Tax=Hymenobacter saemangeumensis TaxID=1084522 RepID=UPI0031E73F5A